MKAIVVKPGVKDSIHMHDMPDPKLKPDHVAVKMIRVGLCGTDAEINNGLYGQPPDGDEFLILGHENLGVVEEVGKKVKAGRPETSSSRPSAVPAASARSARPARTTCAAAAGTPSAASCGATATWRSTTLSRRRT